MSSCGVAELDALLDAVEQRRRADRIAGGGETVRHVAHVVVDAEDLLDDDDALGRAGRTGGIGGKREAVGGFQFDDLTHGCVLPNFGCCMWCQHDAARDCVNGVFSGRAVGPAGLSPCRGTRPILRPSSHPDAAMTDLPLAGLTVLDFGQIFQGPYCTLLLAKAGARCHQDRAARAANRCAGAPSRASRRSSPSPCSIPTSRRSRST